MDDSSTNERVREIHVAVTQLYEDARARTDVIRGVALAAMGVLSVLAALTNLESIARLDGWAIPALMLIAVGLTSSLAVLLKSPVMVPYDSTALAAIAKGSAHDVTTEMLAAITKAESYTRTYNNRAATLVNITLSTFVPAIVVLVFQIALGPRVGFTVGSTAAATVMAAAFLVRKYAFIAPATKGTNNERR